MTELKVQAGDREIKAQAEMVNGVLWFHHEGRNFAFDPRQTSGKKRAKGGSAGAQDIESPMPGKITKLLKSIGEAVRRGEAVVVMEAMKMEYTLKSEIDGVVAEINCKLGDQVGLGQKLVGFKAEGSK